jgi:hypothetical protein
MDVTKPATPILDKMNDNVPPSNIKAGEIDKQATFTLAMKKSFEELTSAVEDGKLDKADVPQLKAAIESLNQLNSNLAAVKSKTQPQTGSEFVPKETAERQKKQYDEILAQDPDYTSTKSALEALANINSALTKDTVNLRPKAFKDLPEEQRAFTLMNGRLNDSLSSLSAAEEKK